MEISRIKEVGELDQKSINLEIITWKIPNVSSIVFAVDYGVQSPPFSFAGASWILKIYFYGQKKFNSVGYIDVVIERLHSEIEIHDSVCTIYFKNIFDKEYKSVSKFFSFRENQTAMNVAKIMENFQGRFDKWEKVPNDTFTLVCEIQHEKSLVKKKSEEQVSGEYNLIIIDIL